MMNAQICFHTHKRRRCRRTAFVIAASGIWWSVWHDSIPFIYWGHDRFIAWLVGCVTAWRIDMETKPVLVMFLATTFNAITATISTRNFSFAHRKNPLPP